MGKLAEALQVMRALLWIHPKCKCNFEVRSTHCCRIKIEICRIFLCLGGPSVCQPLQINLTCPCEIFHEYYRDVLMAHERLGALGSQLF